MAEGHLHSGLFSNTRGTSFFLLVVTGCYLMFEVAFGARLLDVVGGTTDHEEIDRIEFWGRLISGFAVTLLVWSFVVIPFARRHSAGFVLSAFWMACAAGVSCFFTYHLQEQILQAITRSATPAEMRSANLLVLVSSAVHSGDVKLEGAEEVDMSSATGKTLLALMPALALTTQDLVGKTDKETRRILRRKITERLAEGSDRPGAEGVYFGAYEKSVIAMQRLYKNYYDLAMARNNRQISYAIYKTRVTRLLSQEVGSNLSLSSFLSLDVNQKRWRDMLGTPSNIRLRHDESLASFEKRVLSPWLDELVEEEIGAFLGPVEDFGPYGKRRLDGTQAVRIAYVPLIAFVFSIIGALTHSYKTIGLLVSVTVSGQGLVAASIRKGLKMLFGAGALMVAAIPYFIENDATRSELFSRLEAQAEERASPALGVAARWVTQVQPLVYPVAEFIRTDILQDFKYGVDL